MAATQSTRYIDLSGMRFNRWTAVRKVKWKDRTHWLCRCDCGEERIVAAHNLKTGATKSCGCHKRELGGSAITTHGHTIGKVQSVLYTCWLNMRLRCYEPTHKSFKSYGGRGISICNRWLNDFTAFVDDMGERPDGHTLDRRDNDGPYSPDNCRWATAKEQARNQSHHHPVQWNGETLLIAEWAERLGVCPKALRARFAKGWTAERALTQPFRQSPRG